ncbi:MAG: sulfatase-like hydrolase/transferase [Bacteroidetes bacterium]|nr:sulfatase-like hydrolase/transferase [Bacteroidota bacterium]
MSTFFQAIYLDTSMACYFLAFTFLCYILFGFFSKKIFLLINRIYVAIILFLYSIIVIPELKIYDEWGTKMNIKAIRFWEHPSEVINSTSTGFLIFGFIAIGILTFIGFFIHKKICKVEGSEIPFSKRWIGATIFLITIPFLIALGIRGGVQEIPIQQSDAYFSKHNVLNLASVNSGWNLGQSFWENRMNMKGNPYIYFPMEEAKQTVQQLYKTEKDSTIKFLKEKNPNIVLVILESWSADMIHSLGGYDSVTPGFDKLAAQGILFDSIYASGDLSDQGMTAIFSAFPALPSGTSIIGQPGKYGHLPCLNSEFKKIGYTTSYLFGGQLSYGNIKAYMYYNNFDRILEGKDFDSNTPRGKLGVHDEFLYTRQLNELRNEKQPFFAGMFTLSSHSPFDMPMKKKFYWDTDENDYVNGISYADSCLYDFIQKAKKEKWYDNTLFIFVSDHSHRSPKHWVQQQPEYRKIAMMFYGNVIKDEFKGTQYKKICSQIDLAATLLNQFNISSEKFSWSKNLFNPNANEFAFYETHDGFGFVRPNNYLVYSHADNNFPFEKTISLEEKSKLEKEGKSFLQTVFQEYTDF